MLRKQEAGSRKQEAGSRKSKNGESAKRNILQLSLFTYTGLAYVHILGLRILFVEEAK